MPWRHRGAIIATTKLRRAVRRLPHLVRALGLVWDAARALTLAWAALLVVQGLLPAATVYLTKAVVDSVAVVVGAGGGWSALGPAVLPAVLMGTVLLLGQLLRALAGWLRAAQAEAVADHVTGLVHAQAVRLDLAFYDSAAYYDRLHRARAEAAFRPLMLVENLGTLVQGGVTLAAMGALLLPYGLWLPVALVASTLPALYIALRFRAREHAFKQRIAADERRVWYLDWLLTARQTAAEIRIFDLGGRFRSAYQDLRRSVRGERLRLTRDEGLAQLGAGILALAVMGGAMSWMLWRAAHGLATLGDLALFYAAFNHGQGILRSILGNLGQLYGNSLFVGDLFEYLSLEPQVADPAAPLPPPAGIAPATPTAGAPTARMGPAIRFCDVRFSYPGRDDTALRVDLEIAAGTVAAIVGPNGAGKSTLIKLLCRLYDPTQGRIEIDGVDVRAISLADLRRNITVLLQRPVEYAETVAANIAMAVAGRASGEDGLDAQPALAAVGDPAAVRPEVLAAARAAGADEVIARLPKRYDTLLSNWFKGGTDLSKGEWQRIALARAFMRPAPIVILDEPTSALDSWAEAAWIARFRSFAAGRTVIIVTHRLTTAMLADTIHVMDAGRIVESGSHRDLVRRDGRYAASWRAQSAAQIEDADPDPMTEVAGSPSGAHM